MSPCHCIASYVFSALLVTIFEIVFTVDMDAADDDIVEFVKTPKCIYDKTRLNWFACWLLYIILRVFSPIITLVMFTWWALHVGRKDDN